MGFTYVMVGLREGREVCGPSVPPAKAGNPQAQEEVKPKDLHLRTRASSCGEPFRLGHGALSPRPAQQLSFHGFLRAWGRRGQGRAAPVPAPGLHAHLEARAPCQTPSKHREGAARSGLPAPDVGAVGAPRPLNPGRVPAATPSSAWTTRPQPRCWVPVMGAQAGLWPRRRARGACVGTAAAPSMERL